MSIKFNKELRIRMMVLFSKKRMITKTTTTTTKSNKVQETLIKKLSDTWQCTEQLDRQKSQGATVSFR